MQIEMASPSGARVGVPVNAEPGVDVSVVIESQVFKDWAADVDKEVLVVGLGVPLLFHIG